MELRCSGGTGWLGVGERTLGNTSTRLPSSADGSGFSTRANQDAAPGVSWTSRRLVTSMGIQLSMFRQRSSSERDAQKMTTD